MDCKIGETPCLLIHIFMLETLKTQDLIGNCREIFGCLDFCLN